MAKGQDKGRGRHARSASVTPLTGDGWKRIEAWAKEKGISLLPFQLEAARRYHDGMSGIVNAPTGSGKTFALFLPILARWLDTPVPTKRQLTTLWITPLRALAKDIARAMEQVVTELGARYSVGVRTSDTPQRERSRQQREGIDLLITTPESVHMILANEGYSELLGSLTTVVVDEWHELLGTKRGVQMELALSRISALAPHLRIWGMSATIGNLDDALSVLTYPKSERTLVRADITREVEISLVLPEAVERFPWAGHLGLTLLPKVLRVMRQGNAALIFTNTRSHTEIWYQQLLEADPDLAGVIATHHGSLDQDVRAWVEQALHERKLRAVVCTSSLDLGVDFRPVDTVIQVGSPKGVARFLQRAGRSGHAPGEKSRVYFVPTHALEILEGVALREAVRRGIVESRTPIEKPIDVLVQYLLTLAASEGFDAESLFREVTATRAYRNLTRDEWEWIFDFITHGGNSLYAYDEYRKVSIDDEGRYLMGSAVTRKKHRLSIGTIMSDPSLHVKYLRGSSLGTVEESFVGKLKPGDTFWLGGKCVEFLRVHELTVLVRKAPAQAGLVPRWLGGRMPLSAQFARILRETLDAVAEGREIDEEVRLLAPLFEVQRRWSHLPREDEILIEQIRTREGVHLFFYPFEGRSVHEALSLLIAHRLSKRMPISFSIAMNDYGFELLSDKEIGSLESLQSELFDTDTVEEDLAGSINAAELAKRQFREIARISGLVFQGYPARKKKDAHLQASASLFYQTFVKYDPTNLLLAQARSEVLYKHLEGARIHSTLERLRQSTMRFTTPPKPTPFAFPILVDRLRERLSSEKLRARIEKMQLALEKAAS